jgi:hypothetical protein
MSTAIPETRVTAMAILLAVALAACQPASNDAQPSPAPAADEQPAPAPTGDMPSPAPLPAEPPPAAPAEPASVSEPVLAGQPALESMKSARAPAKLSVPVDLRYSFDTEPLANQPAMLHLAAVPRVAGTNLRVQVNDVEGIQVAAGGALNVLKANANGAYRQQYSVTRQGTGPAELRVLVTMDLPQGSGFGFFSIPLDSVKDR